jgi:predicted chitinase
VTKRVNGGTNGIADRQARFKGYWDKIDKDPSTYA